MLGLIGAALFLGDSMITPALSVLSAVEGLKLVAPGLSEFIVPISVAILIGLFAVQSRGTGAMAKLLRPDHGSVVHVSWRPAASTTSSMTLGILAAFNPWYAISFMLQCEGFVGIVVLGAVFLTVTGAEALVCRPRAFRPQADPAGLVLPGLSSAGSLNYLGQGALVLSNPSAMSDPFFLMFPEWALLPIVILATFATIIASQAVITGAFSLVRQAIHLGFLPRMEIFHLGNPDRPDLPALGQHPAACSACMVLVLLFESSEALATAYGISVTGAMVVTTMLPSNSSARSGTGAAAACGRRAHAAALARTGLPRRQTC